jgi:two-component system LytT family response regulator
VFVTAYDEFAMDAFDVKAIDYILKPVEPKRLDETIKKIIQNQTVEFQGIHQKNNRNERLLTVNDSIFIKDNEKCFFLPLAEVRYFESEGNYIKVYFGRNKPLILRSLNSLEERLDSEHFFRANRKHLVNTKWVEKVEPWFNGGLLLELKLPVEFTADQREPEKIEISRRQTIRFKDLFSL